MAQCTATCIVVGLSLVHRLGLGWDREDGGVNWTQIFDDQPVHSIGARSAYSSWARLAAENALDTIAGLSIAALPVLGYSTEVN